MLWVERKLSDEVLPELARLVHSPELKHDVEPNVFKSAHRKLREHGLLKSGFARSELILAHLHDRKTVIPIHTGLDRDR